jgi:hypothetical protein
MSVLRPLLSRRGRLVFVATALLLIAALVAAPSVSGAAPARVKQFLATIEPTTGTPGVLGTWTEEVTNCGVPIVTPCTAASTIGLGAIRIAVPAEFRPVTLVSVATSPTVRNWTASYAQATGNIIATAVSGDKLQPGDSVSIKFRATPTTTTCPPTPFTTAAWGSTSVPGSDSFQIVSAQPAVSVAAPGEGCLGSGGSVTDPDTGQTETIAGNFQGHVNVTFGGDVGPNCSREAGFGDLGDQWEQYHLPTQVTITPASDFVAGSEDKISTSEFLLPEGGGDSSWFLICYAVPQAGHTAFETRGGGVATDDQTIGGIPQFVGILASCVDAPTPCVSEQFLTTGQPNPAPPWTPALNKVHIAVRMAPGDPYKR